MKKLFQYKIKFKTKITSNTLKWTTNITTTLTSVNNSDATNNRIKAWLCQEEPGKILLTIMTIHHILMEIIL